MPRPFRLLAGCGAAVLFASAALAGAGPESQTTPRLTFEVAAIHPSQPGAQGGGVAPMPNGTGYLIQNMSVRTMMAVMYRIPGRQIVGGPGWFDTERYDVETRADRSYSLDDLHTMFKNLLADRFGLKFHIETKNGPVYNLVVDKSGLKMTPEGTAAELNVPIVPRGADDFVGTRVPMNYLCWFLSQQLQSDPRPVIDKTGLTQVYGFTLTFAPQLPLGTPSFDLPPGLANRPGIFEALREQLGLKLEPAKGPVDYYVIDHIDKPSPN